MMEQESKLFNPVDLDLSRSTFDMHPTTSTTLNAGRLIPHRAFFIQPGDSIKMRMRDLMKMVTPVYPTMDALFEDVFFFFVPYRSILNRRYGSPVLNDGIYSWKYFIGAQDNLLNMPLPAEGVKLPTLKFSSGANGAANGSLLDYFPVSVIGGNSGKFSCLPLLAYFAVWNENFRDPNVMDPVTWQFDSDGYLTPSGVVPLYATQAECNGVRGTSATGNYVLVNALGDDDQPDSTASQNSDLWLPFPVCRFHGYFGSLLPWPQRNTEGVELPLGDAAPVYLGAGKQKSLNVILVNDTEETLVNADFDRFGTNNTSIAVGGNQAFVVSREDSENPGTYDKVASVQLRAASAYADLTAATAANVNALRMAIQKQRWYEKLARSGNRYDELEYGLFGVRPHDSGDDRPQYLGGKRIPLSIEMVASTNGGTSSSSGVGAGSLGALGAFSHTNDDDEYFYHSFDDWGILLCVSCVRHHDTFGSGTDRHWMKLIRDDLYFPTFAHLGEQQTWDIEMADKLFSNKVVIGYNPAWECYRTELDRVSGLLKPGRSLAFMTYARNFASGVTLASFLNASSQVTDVDQTLSVTSNAAGFQFISQKTFDMKWRRCMPTTSIPGLMDHF